MALLLWPQVGRGHDPFEITGEARIFADRLELAITMSAGTARKACSREGAPPPRLATGPNDQAEERYEQRALELFKVSTEAGKLVPTKARAALTEENDLRFWVDYPLPPAGLLTIEATCLKALPQEGYGVSMIAMEQARPPGRVLGEMVLTFDEPALVVEPSPPQPVPVSTVTPGGAEATPRWRWLIPLVVILIGVAIAGLVAGRRRLI